MRERAPSTERERASSWLCVLLIPSLFERVASPVGREAYVCTPMVGVFTEKFRSLVRRRVPCRRRLSCIAQYNNLIHRRFGRWSLCSYVVSSARWSTLESRVHFRRYIFAAQFCLSVEFHCPAKASMCLWPSTRHCRCRWVCASKSALWLLSKLRSAASRSRKEQRSSEGIVCVLS